MGLLATARLERAQAISEALLFRLLVLFVPIWQIGAHVDAWYHLHYGFNIESFFTWPHALLYAGWASTGVAAVALLWLHGGRLSALSPGYRLVLLGSGLFGLGGAFDLIWHTLFGFEVNQEALLSPAHLWLVSAFTLCAFGLFLAAVARRTQTGATPYRMRLVDVPVILGLGELLRAALWSLFYSEPLAVDYAAGGALARQLPGYAAIAWNDQAAQIAGSTGLILHSVLLVLFVVAPLRYLRLPGGAITGIVLWSALLSVAATDQWRYLPAVVGTAVIGEVIWRQIRRGHLGGPMAGTGYWVLGTALPVVQFALYFLLMQAGPGITWTAHLWVGAIALAGFYGLIVSLLAVPPRELVASLMPQSGR